jgi:DNA repair exonuclease SbcCD ATPase subunit
MELSEETLKTIGRYVKGNLAEWMREVGSPVPATDPRLLERMVRVEESLEHQRELMERGFARNDQRFEELRQDFRARLDQVDKRFEQVDKRFEQVDKRLEEERAQLRRLTAVMTTILSVLTVLVGYGTFVG